MKAKWQWVCRDNDGWYAVCPLQNIKPVKRMGSWAQRDRKGVCREVIFSAARFESLFPKFKLKLGEGPKRVELTAKFVD